MIAANGSSWSVGMILRSRSAFCARSKARFSAAHKATKSKHGCQIRVDRVALGIPAGGAIVAGALYRASIAAEKEARKNALRDIARIIRDPSWSRAFRRSAAIRRLFCLTFGEKHLSWKCVRRSSYATLTFILSIGLQPIPNTHHPDAGLECGAKCSVIVANEISRCTVPRECFVDLARKPLCRWVSGHRNPQQLPPSVAENKKCE
jgi:hypothetical protein